MKNLVFGIITLVLLNACKHSQDNPISDAVAGTSMHQSIGSNQYQASAHAEMHDTWKEIDDVFGDWTSLERDKEGYLIYSPCNGTTPRLRVNEGKVTIFWKLEGLNSFRIEKIKMNSKNEIVIYSKDFDNEETIAVFKIHIADSHRKLVVWEWNIDWPIYQGGHTSYKWITTRSIHEQEFRHVDNPCPKGLIKEKEFLELEY